MGWSTADHLKTELCLDALQMALDHRVGVEGLLHHSDRGVQLGFKGSSQHLRIEELRWRRASVDDQIMRYVHRCVHLAVLGSRVKLLGRKIERGEIRHYAGRIFATCASVTLGIAFYDTQCGSKLFRNDPEVRRCFQEPFLGRWTFDVEILARMIAGRRRAGDGSIDELVYEYPLRIWREFGESKVRPWDLLTGLWDLTRIRRHYFGRAEARRSIVGEPSPRPVGSGRPTQGRDSQR